VREEDRNSYRDDLGCFHCCGEGHFCGEESRWIVIVWGLVIGSCGAVAAVRSEVTGSDLIRCCRSPENHVGDC